MSTRAATVATRQRAVKQVASANPAPRSTAKPATIERSGPVKRTKVAKPAAEPLFQLVRALPGGGFEDATELLSKGELLAMLAEEIMNNPAGPGKKVVPFKIPASLPKVVDMLYQTRQDRLNYDHKSAAMKVHERALREHLIDTLPKSDSTGVAGRLALAQVKIEDTATVTDWEVFYKNLKKTGQFDLLNKALNRSAVKERWNAGKEVPGVGHFDNVKISLTKVGGGT